MHTLAKVYTLMFDSEEEARLFVKQVADNGMPGEDVIGEVRNYTITNKTKKIKDFGVIAYTVLKLTVKYNDEREVLIS